MVHIFQGLVEISTYARSSEFQKECFMPDTVKSFFKVNKADIKVLILTPTVFIEEGPQQEYIIYCPTVFSVTGLSLIWIVAAFLWIDVIIPSPHSLG